MKPFIKKYYKKFAIFFIIGMIADIIVDYLQLFIPEFLGEMIEIVSTKPNPQYSDIRHIIINIFIVATSLLIGRLIMRFNIMTASGKIEAGIRHDMFLKAEKLSQRYYHENKVGNIMSWFSSDVETMEEFTGWGTIMIVDALFLSIMSIIKMVRLDLLLSLIAVAPMVALVIWGNKAEKNMTKAWDDRQNSFDKLYDFTQETFTGIRVIKAFVKEAQERIAFSKVAQDNSEKNLTFAKTHIGLDVEIELIIGILFITINAFGAYLVYRTVSGDPVNLFGYLANMSASRLITFIGYADTLIWPMIAMGQILQMYSRFKTSSERIAKYLDEEEEIHNVENAVTLYDCKGSIRFNDFSFTYPGSTNHSLNNISFEIKPGEMVGIVGKIGSGKTTLVNSLLRLYNIEKGKIFIDDVDIMDLDITSVRDNISYVPQDNFLFSDNIKNNIAFANRKTSIDTIKDAAKFADVDENISSFTDGYETITGERGVTLSGGQKQRISIARAYLKNAPIMIMDDSVSAVDVKTEETILKNITEKRKNKTTIIIASRVSTVSKLDKILVLKDGQVEAFDKPSKLLKTSPTYKKMVHLQKLESEL